jgi:hypothetical protein
MTERLPVAATPAPGTLPHMTWQGGPSIPQVSINLAV